MDMSHNYYLSFYKAGLKPFNTLASLEALYKDWESHRGEWLDSTSRVDFIEGQKLLIEAINYIKSTQNNNNNHGGNNMNTNETKKIMIEVEVPVYEDSLDEVLAIINKNTQEIEVAKKKIGINSNSVVDQVIGYIDAVVRPLLNKQPNILFNHGYYGAVSKKYQVIRDSKTEELEQIALHICYEGYYKAIKVKITRSYGDRYFDIWVTPNKGTYLQLNDHMSKNDVSLFLARNWNTIKIQLDEAIEDGKKKAIEESNNQLLKHQDELKLFNNFKL